VATAFHARLQFGAAEISVSLPRDFYHNSLTRDPYSHSHPKYEVHYVLTGGCTLITETGQLPCPRGHFLILPPRKRHCILPDGGEVQTISFLYAIEGAEAKGAGLPACAEPVLIRDEFLGEERLMLIRSELVGGETAGAEVVRGELLILLAMFARHCGNAVHAAEDSRDDNRVDMIETYLANHRNDPGGSCRELAREMGLSTRQVHRLCMKYFGAPFRTLRSNARMETAAYRLENTDISVRELAAELGYASVESFSGAFKRRFGVAPTDRRRRGK